MSVWKFCPTTSTQGGKLDEQCGSVQLVAQCPQQILLSGKPPEICTETAQAHIEKGGVGVHLHFPGRDKVPLHRVCTGIPDQFIERAGQHHVDGCKQLENVMKAMHVETDPVVQLNPHILFQHGVQQLGTQARFLPFTLEIHLIDAHATEAGHLDVQVSGQ